MVQSFFMRTTKTDQNADAHADLSLHWAHMSEGTLYNQPSLYRHSIKRQNSL